MKIDNVNTLSKFIFEERERNKKEKAIAKNRKLYN